MVSPGLLHNPQQNVTKNVANFANYMAILTNPIAKL